MAVDDVFFVFPEQQVDEMQRGHPRDRFVIEDVYHFPGKTVEDLKERMLVRRNGAMCTKVAKRRLKDENKKKQSLIYRTI